MRICPRASKARSAQLWHQARPRSVWLRSVPLPRTMIRPDIAACHHLAKGSPDPSRLTVACWIFSPPLSLSQGGRREAKSAFASVGLHPVGVFSVSDVVILLLAPGFVRNCGFSQLTRRELRVHVRTLGVKKTEKDIFGRKR